MAELSEQDRVDLHTHFQRVSSNLREPLGLDKDELREAVDSVVDGIPAIRASYNNSLPAKARNVLSAKQKARMFMDVYTRLLEVT